MPHLLFRGVEAELLRKVAAPLAKKLAILCSCGTDNFTMNVMNATNVYGGAPDEPAFAFIEVGWFERGQQVRNSFAHAVTQYVRQLGINEIEIVFHAYREESYYINGEPVKS
ncbi:DUF1904 domain-containing protein [Paenibacillus alkaliterrae]|uniref:DUF1904 family protein n=1 Tax=Paenibacillus alkaliterrae TaxID=320909 RepID=UPI001F438D4E|nr:DUF1904 family protein [Paenibacillus alkaliterrae]MCF2938593.1 DUF1904 domain-containing protein [Paenibacillus alkaliterrae]